MSLLACSKRDQGLVCLPGDAGEVRDTTPRRRLGQLPPQGVRGIVAAGDSMRQGSPLTRLRAQLAELARAVLTPTDKIFLGAQMAAVRRVPLVSLSLPVRHDGLLHHRPGAPRER